MGGPGPVTHRPGDDGSDLSAASTSCLPQRERCPPWCEAARAGREHPQEQAGDYIVAYVVAFLARLGGAMAGVCRKCINDASRCEAKPELG